MLEETVDGDESARYAWSPVYIDAMVLRDRDSDGNGSLDERLWTIQDANFNVVALVDGSWTVVERYAYDPYGVQTMMDAGWNVLGASAYGFTHGFQGLKFDEVARLSDARNRWYSPTLGRFVTNDPIQYEAGDVNFYRFVGNNPINFVDPSGLQAANNCNPCQGLRDMLDIWLAYEAVIMGYEKVKPVLNIIAIYRAATPDQVREKGTLKSGIELATRVIANRQLNQVIPDKEGGAEGRRFFAKMIIKTVAEEIIKGTINLNATSICFELAECESANGNGAEKVFGTNGFGNEILKCEWCAGSVSFKKWGLKYAMGFRKWDGVAD